MVAGENEWSPPRLASLLLDFIKEIKLVFTYTVYSFLIKKDVLRILNSTF
jgi:hypothetical protein